MSKQINKGSKKYFRKYYILLLIFSIIFFVLLLIFLPFSIIKINQDRSSIKYIIIILPSLIIPFTISLSGFIYYITTYKKIIKNKEITISAKIIRVRKKVHYELVRGGYYHQIYALEFLTNYNKYVYFFNNQDITHKGLNSNWYDKYINDIDINASFSVYQGTNIISNPLDLSNISKRLENLSSNKL